MVFSPSVWGAGPGGRQIRLRQSDGFGRVACRRRLLPRAAPTRLNHAHARTDPAGRGGMRGASVRHPTRCCSPKRSRSSATPYQPAAVTTPPYAAAPEPASKGWVTRRFRSCPGSAAHPPGRPGCKQHDPLHRLRRRRRRPTPTDLALGIDAEPDAPLPDGVLGLVATPPNKIASPPRPNRTARTGTGCCSAPKRPSTRHGSP